MTDPGSREPRWGYWPQTDAAAPLRLRDYPAGETPAAELGEALAHTLRDVEQHRVGVRALEFSMGEGPEHPAQTIVRALLEDAYSGKEKPPHFDDPAFRETAFALGQRLVREYAPEPPQPNTEGPQHG